MHTILEYLNSLRLSVKSLILTKAKLIEKIAYICCSKNWNKNDDWNFLANSRVY